MSKLLDAKGFLLRRLRQRIPVGVEKFIRANAIGDMLLNKLRSGRSLYPVAIPALEVKPDLDVLLVVLPPLYLPMMPNGIGYVHNAMKQCNIRTQVIDANIVLYHRYHSLRLGGGPLARIPVVDEAVLRDPWDVAHVTEWHRAEVVEHFWPQVEEIIQSMERNPPKAVGLTLIGNNRELAKRFVAAVRARLPQVIVMVGGYDCLFPHVGLTVFPDFDYMAIGEAELSIKPLVMALAKGERPKDLRGILSKYDSPGRAWTEATPLANLDSVAFPTYDWIDPMLYQTFDSRHMVPIVSTRGCRFSNCRFCGEAFPFKKRTPTMVVDEMEFFTRQGFSQFCFNESDVNGVPKSLSEICDEIIKRKMKVELTGQLRIDKRDTKEYLSHLAKAGFTHLIFGVDAWSENLLRQQRKGYTMKMVFENLENCTSAGIRTYVNLLVGVPGETEEDIDQTIENIIHCKDNFYVLNAVNTLILTGGSEYYRNPEKYGIRFRGDKDEIQRQHPYYVPLDLWYSENPYIDQEVRVARLKRILKGLVENGVSVCALGRQMVQNIVSRQEEREAACV